MDCKVNKSIFVFPTKSQKLILHEVMFEVDQKISLFKPCLFGYVWISLTKYCNVSSTKIISNNSSGVEFI